MSTFLLLWKKIMNEIVQSWKYWLNELNTDCLRGLCIGLTDRIREQTDSVHRVKKVSGKQVKPLTAGGR